MIKNQFDFGENWADFAAKSLNAVSIAKSRQDFNKLIAQLGDKRPLNSFLDIGFGQGLGLLIASESFTRVIGCDINPKCLTALKLTGTHFQHLQSWPDAAIGSILDDRFIESLLSRNEGKFDIVHSWGVLHHTGDMWRAIDNATRMVADGGYFIVAIYNRHWTSHVWKLIKYLYVNAPHLFQRQMVWSLYWLKKVAGYQRGSDYRGMSFYHDIVDWVGGYPYEFASKDEIVMQLNARGFQLISWFPTSGYTGCNEFIFRKTAS